VTDSSQLFTTDAANTLRAWALDERLKSAVMGSPALASVAARVARRYVAGDTIVDALEVARACVARGHAVSVEYAGESVRDSAIADAETEVFLALVAALSSAGLPSTVSFDLTHVGALVNPALGLANARRIAAATAPLGTALMISAEGSSRTDLILDTYDQLSADHPHVGITVQARLHRTPEDLDRVMDCPGTIRLVKGAFLESESDAHARGSSELHEAYLGLATKLIDSGHPVSIATHDLSLIDMIRHRHAAQLGEGDGEVEFEMLLGLGTATLDNLHRDGLRTREYVVFGGEWWLYVLNRIAEDPERVFDAIVDAGGGY
jgi:proline dehydrogenase